MKNNKKYTNTILHFDSCCKKAFLLLKKSLPINETKVKFQFAFLSTLLFFLSFVR